MKRTWVLGDVHGNFKGLKQAWERANVQKGDRVVSLGDIVDGWSESYECVQFLIDKLDEGIDMIYIKGNHDDEFDQWLTYGIHRWNWLQGGDTTAKSYIKHAERDDILFAPKNGGFMTNLTTWDIPQEHIRFFNNQELYFIDSDRNICFVHGGFNRHIEFKGQPEHVYYWDRDLWLAALSWKEMPNNLHPATGERYAFKMKTPFNEVFIGHTATVNWDTTEPMNAANIWNVDTGGGFKGKVTLMDVDTKEYFQSDLGSELYPDEKGRMG